MLYKYQGQKEIRQICAPVNRETFTQNTKQPQQTPKTLASNFRVLQRSLMGGNSKAWLKTGMSTATDEYPTRQGRIFAVFTLPR
jgi:hypothetical protein